jgi:Amt family ammonium transporter
MTSAALGCLVLWLGWFGFNPGSTMAAMNGTAIAHILVNTNMAAATGALGAMCTAWLLLGKPDLSMILNGCLAGLVGITAVRVRDDQLRRGHRLRRGRAGGLRRALLHRSRSTTRWARCRCTCCAASGALLALGIFYDNDVATNIAALATGSRAARRSWCS